MMRSLAQTGSDNNLCLGFWEFKVLEESLNQGLRYLTLSVPGWKRGRWWGQKGCWSPGEARAGNYWHLSCCGLYQCPLWKKSCLKTCTKTPLLSREIIISFLPPLSPVSGSFLKRPDLNNLTIINISSSEWNSVVSLLGRKPCTFSQSATMARRLCVGGGERCDPLCKLSQETWGHEPDSAKAKEIKIEDHSLVESIYRHPHGEEVEQTVFGQLAEVFSYV